MMGGELEETRGTSMEDGKERGKVNEERGKKQDMSLIFWPHWETFTQANYCVQGVYGRYTQTGGQLHKKKLLKINKRDA